MGKETMTVRSSCLFVSLAVALGMSACSDSADPPASAESAAFVDGVPETLPSGLVITEVTAGSGPSPASTDRVRVHYHGTFPDGKVFDSSVERGQPAVFPLNRVIPCWTEGLQRMQVGGKANLVCPPAIAYGPRGAPPRIPANATLHFEVELLGIE